MHGFALAKKFIFFTSNKAKVVIQRNIHCIFILYIYNINIGGSGKPSAVVHGITSARSLTPCRKLERGEWYFNLINSSG